MVINRWFDFIIIEINEIGIPLCKTFFGQERSIGCHRNHIGITFERCEIYCFAQGIVQGISARCIFTKVDFGFRTIVFVVKILIVDKPSRILIVMFINYRNVQLIRNFPALNIISTFRSRSHCSDNGNFGMLFFYGIIYFSKTLFEYISNQIFIANADVFQVKRCRMSGLGAFFTPDRFYITVTIFNQIENILNISIHFAHGDATLLTGSSAGRILTGYPRSNYGHRFGSDIFAELQVFKITQSGGLVIIPQIALWFAGFQWSDCIFPSVNVSNPVAMSYTTARKTNKARMQFCNGFGKIGTQPVSMTLECLLRKQ